MNPIEIINRKREGEEHSREEIEFFLAGYIAGRIPDYQVAAWLMAVVLRGMTPGETLALTQAMVASGDVMDLSSVEGVKVDKHSTGGVGDKVTLIACPLAAACGVPVPKLSGRALAHTGGTLDKLESIPGLTVDLDPARFVAQVAGIGIAVAAQSATMVPADKALYALRDVTGTVASVPLIAASVMAKKIAAGADAIVLDVKAGRGAFMPNEEGASLLAERMLEIGEGAGRRTVALITAMDDPLGHAVGNSLEVVEALEVLGGGGDGDLREVALQVAREMCLVAGVSVDPARALADGRGRERFEKMIAAQGGRLSDGLPVARATAPVRATVSGWVSSVDALLVGRAAVEAGAGRLRKEDLVDPAAGIVISAMVGHEVRVGDILATVHAGSTERAQIAAQGLSAAWRTAPEPVARRPHILRRLP